MIPPPWPLPVFKEPEDIEKVEVPDPRTSGLCPKCLEYYKWMKAHTDSAFRHKYGYLDGWAFYMLGPFDTAALLRGVTNFMVDLYLHPDLAEKLLDAVTGWEISWIKLQDEEIGPLRLFNVSDDNSGNISREFFERFVFPYFKRIYDELHFIRFRQLHNDANVHHIMDRIPDLGCNVFIAFNPEIDISEFKRRIGDRVCLVGNVDPLEVLLRGTPENVERECRREIEVAAPGGGYCLCSGGEISRGTPAENIDAMISAAKKYGRYPIEV